MKIKCGSIHLTSRHFNLRPPPLLAILAAYIAVRIEFSFISLKLKRFLFSLIDSVELYTQYYNYQLTPLFKTLRIICISYSNNRNKFRIKSTNPKLPWKQFLPHQHHHKTEKWSERCMFWDLDFRQYGPDKMVFPASCEKWADFIRNMHVREDDVWIITFPKCGTTWTQEMVWMICNNLDYETASKKTLHERCQFLEFDSFFRLPGKWDGVNESNKPLTSMEEIDKMASPRMIKTHLPLSLLPKELMEKSPKIVYVARNPKEVSVSYYHHSILLPGYRGTLEDFVDSFVSDNVLYSPYWANLQSFYDLRHESNVLFLTYEEMKRNLRSVVLNTAEFFGKEYNTSQIDKLLEHISFENMRNNPSVNWESVAMDCYAVHQVQAKTKFIRKGKVDSWKDELSQDSINKLDKWIAANGIRGLYSTDNLTVGRLQQ